MSIGSSDTALGPGEHAIGVGSRRPRTAGQLRLLGLVEGDPARALSGVGQRLLTALGRRLCVVGCIDYQPHGMAKLALAAGTFRPARSTWRARFHTSPLAQRTLSMTLARRLRSFEPEFDLALQVHGWVSRQPQPYALYVDQTRMMAERGWPQWLPLSVRERPRILELERRMYLEARHVLVMGEPAARSLIDDYGIDPERISVVGGGLMFDTMPPPAALSPEPLIAFVGRDFERKGGEEMLKAFALVRGEIPAASLHLVGVERPIAQAGVVCRGTLHGRERMAALYRSSRVFCMPSRYEPFGFVFGEAMAHGVPCVGTSVQSIPEILDHGRAGILVAPGDVDALAAALLRLLTDDELAQRLGAAGRAHVERCMTWDHVAARAVPSLERAAAAG